ncbi:VOC family protein [Chromobacterium phragmitis]|uniref:VOC family protein n=1 Tax=Chromobacterium phragmitis TaxID=2202141 RepID=UPI003263D2D6
MHITGLHHVAIIASDYARSRDFYCRVLNLEVIAENWREERQSWKLDLALPGGGQIELFLPRHPAGPAQRQPAHPQRRTADRRRAGRDRRHGGAAEVAEDGDQEQRAERWHAATRRRCGRICADLAWKRKR